MHLPDSITTMTDDDVVTGVTLDQLISFSEELCSLIHDNYGRISKKLVDMVSVRLISDDEVDSPMMIMDPQQQMHYKGEMHLRQLYCSLKGQSINDSQK